MTAYLRPWRAADAAVLLRALAVTADLANQLPVPLPHDEPSAQAFIARKSVAAVARWAFDIEDLFRLELGHRVNNPASCRVATSAGFRAEGIERQKLRYGDHRFDVETHARLATDPEPGVEPLPIRED